MRTLTLVSCVSQKGAQAAPAADLYVSDWFRKARAFVEASGGPWFILSAAYGLLDPAQVIPPYEATLHSMTRDERQAWAASVAGELRRRGVKADRCVVLAGRAYRDPLMVHLRALFPWIDVPLEGLGIGQQKAALRRLLNPTA